MTIARLLARMIAGDSLDESAESADRPWSRSREASAGPPEGLQCGPRAFLEQDRSIAHPDARDDVAGVQAAFRPGRDFEGARPGPGGGCLGA
jgi:hypothetical protein